MASRNGLATGLRYIPVALVALLLGIGLLTSDTFAGAPLGAPKANAPTSQKATDRAGSEKESIDGPGLPSITVLKINDLTGQPIPGWTMRLRDGPGCVGPVLDTQVTDANGIVDFTGLISGHSYSVEEEEQPGWTPVSGTCQDVTTMAPSSGGVPPLKGVPLDYPPAGTDNFPSGAHVTIEVDGFGKDNVTLSGPTTVLRGNPCIGCGPGGRTIIQTEMVAMTLVGQSPLFGPVQVQEATPLPSQGQITQQTPGVDYPADSFFDVFVEIQTPLGPLHNNQPIRMQSVINNIPPLLSVYMRPTQENVELYDPIGQPRGRIRQVIHVPLPPNERFIVFRNRPPERSITVIKLNDTSNQPMPGWTMTLHSGLGCTGPTLGTLVTDANGMVDFTGLGPGDYSVAETEQPGWQVVGSACQDVSLTAAPSGEQAGLGAEGGASRPDYPPAGNDTFPSGAHVILDLIGFGSSEVTLNGPATVQRGNPCIGCGPGGRDTIQTELVSMSLVGTSSFGSVQVDESLSLPSIGEISQQTPGTDFPADSFFDVFVDIQTPLGVFHNNQPIRMQSVIDAIPPVNALYYPPIPTPIPLYNTSGTLVGYIRHALHVPLPPGEILIVFRNRPLRSIVVIKINHATNQPIPGWTMQLHDGPGCTGPILNTLVTDASGMVDFTYLKPGNYSVSEVLQAGWTPVTGVCQDVPVTLSPEDRSVVKAASKSGSSPPDSPDYPPAGSDNFPSGGHVTIEIIGMGQDNVTLEGPTLVNRNNPCIGCGPGGRDIIDTEIVAMNLTGYSPVFVSPIQVQESPSFFSIGRISQQTPGTDFPADSFFDVFVEIQTPMGILHNNQPIRMESVINAIPPLLAVYIPPIQQSIPLFDAGNNLRGFIRHSIHVPLPPYERFIVFRNNPPTATPTNTPTRTSTSTPTRTSTSTPTRTSTSTSTSTSTPTRTPIITNTPTDTPTNTPTDTPTDTPTRTPIVNPPTNTPTDTPTRTPIIINTSTNTPSNTPTRTPINTSTNTPTITNTPTATPTCLPVIVDVSIQDLFYMPMNLVVGTGTTVRWTNNGAVIHSTTSNTLIWDSGIMAPAAQFLYTFNVPGIYPYHCVVHPNMMGSIQVVPITGCPPTASPTNTRTNTATRTPVPSATNTPTATSTITPGGPTLTPTPTARPVLVGHVLWQGRFIAPNMNQPDPKQQYPITLTLKMGALEVNYPQQTTDASGFFTVPVHTLPNGTYAWRVKGPHGVPFTNTGPGFLANRGLVNLTGAMETQQEMGRMRAGDADNDNVVDVQDFNILKNTFGCAPGTCDERADFNGDNVVEILDFNLLKINFGILGDLEIWNVMRNA